MNTTKQKITLLLNKNSVKKLKSIKKETGAGIGFQVDKLLGTK